MDYTQKAERNLFLYIFVRIFAKRVFLPLSAIYFVSVSGLSIEEIGILAAVSAAVGMVLEVPSGYFSDRFGKTKSIRIAGLLNAIATLIFVLVQNKTGVFIGIIFESIGYTFLSGAGEALLHDSLETLKRPNEYSKVAARAQSHSLLINAVIIALVPMTYAIDERLPFLVGTLAYIGLLVVGFLMNDMPRRKQVEKQSLRPKLSSLKHHRSLIIFVILFGLGGALFTAPSDLKNLALEEYGVQPEFLGWLFSIGSVVGALFGYKLHLLKQIPLKAYIAIDGFVLVLSLLAYASGSAIVASIGFVLIMSFWRYRKIIYHDYLLNKYSTSYKTTLLSALSNVEQFHRIWLPVVMAVVISNQGNQRGFLLISIATALVLVPYSLSINNTLKK